VQVYAGHLPTAIETEPSQLVGFARVTLEPGERRQVTATIDRRSLSAVGLEHRHTELDHPQRQRADLRRQLLTRHPLAGRLRVK